MSITITIDNYIIPDSVRNLSSDGWRRIFQLIDEIKHTSSLDINQKSLIDRYISDSLTNKLGPLNRFYFGSAMEKGDIGEHIIRDELMKYGNIIDISSLAHSGDIYFNINDIHLMIEVKNKISIQQDDLDKFAENAQSPNYNCALLVSLRSNHFPGIGQIQMHKLSISGKPALYMYVRSVEEIRFAVDYFKNAKAPAENLPVSAAKSFLKEQIKDYLKQISRYKKDIKSLEVKIKKCQKLVE
jgi:hypothetical protein